MTYVTNLLSTSYALGKKWCFLGIFYLYFIMKKNLLTFGVLKFIYYIYNCYESNGGSVKRGGTQFK